MIVPYVRKIFSDYSVLLYLLGSMEETGSNIVKVKDKSHKNIMQKSYQCTKSYTSTNFKARNPIKAKSNLLHLQARHKKVSASKDRKNATYQRITACKVEKKHIYLKYSQILNTITSIVITSELHLVYTIHLQVFQNKKRIISEAVPRYLRHWSVSYHSCCYWKKHRFSN